MILTLFFWAMMTLFVATLIFYIVVFSLIYYWHLNKVNFIIVPLLFTFEFFLSAFLFASLAVIVLNYTPVILDLFAK